MISRYLFVNSTEDKNRDKVDPEVLAKAPDLTDNGLYNFFWTYVQRVHSNDFIWRALKGNPQTSFVNFIGPSDIVYVIAIIKNSGEVWDQDVTMKKRGLKRWGAEIRRSNHCLRRGRVRSNLKVRVYGIRKG
jgi:hypothetical protein